jgi:hypothetical protein
LSEKIKHYTPSHWRKQVILLTCPAFIGWVDAENAEKGYFYTKTNHIINTVESTHQSMNRKNSLSKD